jgi:hypothetical protein
MYTELNSVIVWSNVFLASFGRIGASIPLTSRWSKEIASVYKGGRAVAMLPVAAVIGIPADSCRRTFASSIPALPIPASAASNAVKFL